MPCSLAPQHQMLLSSLTGLDVSVPPPNTVSVAGNVLGPLTAAVAILAIVVFVLAGFLLRPAMKKPLLQRLM